MACFKDLTPGELVALANLIAIAIAEGKDKDELDAIANLVTTTGSLLESIVSQIELRSNKPAEAQDVEACRNIST